MHQLGKQHLESLGLIVSTTSGCGHVEFSGPAGACAGVTTTLAYNFWRR